MVWSPAITPFRASTRRTDPRASRSDAEGDATADLRRTERDVFDYEALRHVAAYAVVCAPAAFGAGLLDDLLPGRSPPVRVLAALLAGLACAALGGWPRELIGRDRRVVRLRLAVFTLAILLLVLHATVAIETHPTAGAGVEFLVMMAAAIPLAPWPLAAVPFAVIAGDGAWRTLPAPALAVWLLSAAVAAILVMGTRFRARIRLNVRLHSQRERLETLLVDYEHGSSELRWEAGADGMLRMARAAATAASGGRPPRSR